MKTIIYALCFGACFFSPAFAVDDHWDAVRTLRVCCDDNSKKCNINVGNDVRAFCDFPNATSCRDGNWLQDDYWRSCSQTMCSGYDYSRYDDAKMKPKAQYDSANTSGDKTICWKWECKAGYVQTNTDECITDAECSAISGYQAKNGVCEKTNWCAGDWMATFSSLKYKQFTNTAAGCEEYRCIDGGFTSATDKSCVPISPSGTAGGKYPNDSGVITECPKTKRLTIVTRASVKTYNCNTDSLQITNDDMNKCFRCQHPADFESCVKFKGKASATGALLPCAKRFDNDNSPSWDQGS
ncbi:MAG: hypothetical protein LBJ73_01375 [Rickettsiales bacterium]|jgi:hypothetical protein|nr:hypothetical protein [Rickettsiales bacterium]